MLLTVFCLRRDRSEITFNLQVDADFELQNFRALCELESGIPAAESQVRACPRPTRRGGPGRCPRARSGRAPFSHRVRVSWVGSGRVPHAPRGRVPGSAPASRSLGLFGAVGPSRSLPSRTFGVWAETPRFSLKIHTGEGSESPVAWSLRERLGPRPPRS